MNNDIRNGRPVNCTDSELCTYLQALEAGFLPTFCLDTASSAPSKSMRIANRSYRVGKKTVCFRGFRFTMTLRSLTADRGGDFSTASAEDSRAKTSVRRETEPGSPARSLPFGLKCSASFGRYDRATSSWRTPTDLLGEDWTLSSGAWPKAGTMRNGACYPRTTLVPRIYGNAAGFSPGSPEFPTPKSSDATRGDCPSERRRRQPALIAAVKTIPTPTTRGIDGGSHSRAAAKRRGTWITPSASDATRGGTITDNMSGASLVQQVNTPNRWPTPKANDAEKRGNFANDPRNGLPAAVKYLPTPTAEDSKTRSNPSQLRRKSPPLSAVAKYLPTPTVQDAKCCGSASQQSRNTPPLNAVVKTLPTPLASDHKYRLQGDSQQSISLGALAARTGQGQLNPDWVSWLMNWPISWTDISASTKTAKKDFLFWLKHQNSWFDEEIGQRTTTVTKNRVNRLRALGNGQVAICAATAFRILYRRMNDED